MVFGLAGTALSELSLTEKSQLFSFKDVSTDAPTYNGAFCSVSIVVNEEGELFKNAKPEGQVALKSIFPPVRIQIEVKILDNGGIHVAPVPFSTQRLE
jgi:hypothetical protein